MGLQRLMNTDHKIGYDYAVRICSATRLRYHPKVPSYVLPHFQVFHEKSSLISNIHTFKIVTINIPNKLFRCAYFFYVSFLIAFIYFPINLMIYLNLIMILRLYFSASTIILFIWAAWPNVWLNCVSMQFRFCWYSF